MILMLLQLHREPKEIKHQRHRVRECVLEALDRSDRIVVYVSRGGTYRVQ